MTTATTPDLEPAATEAFAARIRGAVLRPGDDGYDDARRDLERADRPPAGADRPGAAGAADVVDAVNFAREQGLLLSVKGGGHNVAGNAVNDGGLVIDLSRMRGVHVDRGDRRTVRVQGGATWGDVRPRDAALRARRPRRRRLDDRHRRPDAARRRRAPAPQARPLDRQPALGRHRHRRRAAAAGERDARTRTSSGPCAAPAATSASSRRSSSRRTRSARWSMVARDLLSAGRVRDGPARPGATSWRRRRTS